MGSLGLNVGISVERFNVQGKKIQQGIYNSLPKNVKALFEPYVKEHISWLMQCVNGFIKCCCGPKLTKYKYE